MRYVLTERTKAFYLKNKVVGYVNLQGCVHPLLLQDQHKTPHPADPCNSLILGEQRLSSLALVSQFSRLPGRSQKVGVKNPRLSKMAQQVKMLAAKSKVMVDPWDQQMEGEN